MSTSTFLVLATISVTGIALGVMPSLSQPASFARYVDSGAALEATMDSVGTAGDTLIASPTGVSTGHAADSLRVAEADSTDAIGIAGAPYVTYAPETQVELGLAGVISAHLDKRRVRQRRASTLGIGLYVTQLQQFSVTTKFDVYFNELQSRITGRIAFERMPNRFYGFGPYSEQTDEVWYRPSYLRTELAYYHRIMKTEEGQGLTIGGRFEYWNTKMYGEIPQPPTSVEPTGWHGGVSTGLGLVATFDTRDNAYYPTTNEYIELRSVQYSDAIGGTFDYNRSYADLRKFFSASIGSLPIVIATQVLWDATFGNSPFYDTPTYGGADKMRGVLAGRYVDHSSLVAQAEVHTKLFWIMGAAAFVSIGDVAPRIDKHSLAHTKLAGGLGVRGYLDQQGGLIGRLDVGFSEWGTGVYIAFAEAF